MTVLPLPCRSVIFLLPAITMLRFESCMTSSASGSPPGRAFGFKFKFLMDLNKLKYSSLRHLQCQYRITPSLNCNLELHVQSNNVTVILIVYTQAAQASGLATASATLPVAHWHC